MIKLNLSFVAFLIALSGIIFGYFVADRDENLEEQVCAQMQIWHPDCKIG